MTVESGTVGDKLVLHQPWDSGLAASHGLGRLRNIEDGREPGLAHRRMAPARRVKGDGAPGGERMAEPSGRALVERYARALQDKDLDALALHFADDYVDEMPQSGERLVVPAYQPAGGVMPRSCPRSGLVNGSSSTILPSARR